MSNNSHSSRKDKDGHNSYSKRINTRGSIDLGSPKMDSTGLRRSPRETSSKKQLSSSPSSTRKSERLDKRSAVTPLQQSERSKKLQVSTFSGTKKSSRLSGLKCKKDKKEDLNSVGIPNNRMDARAYRSWFRSHRTKADMADRTEELKKPDMSPGGGCSDSMLLKNGIVGKSCETSREGSDSSSVRVENEALGNQGDSQSPAVDSQAADDLAVIACDEEAKSLSPKLPVITCKEKPLKGEIVGGVCDPITQNDNETRTSTPDGVFPLLSGSKRVAFVETCVTCSKRRRLNNDTSKQELCSCSAELDQILSQSSSPKDRGAHEAFMSTAAEQCCNNDNVHQKLFPSDFQGNVDHNACCICRKGGKLLCCEGNECKRSFHLSCLDPPLDEVPPGNWYCLFCVNKRMVLGVHSVSEGIESIWDFREVQVSSHKEGLQEQREKQYFVKYKGLAHIHNNWVPETQLILEAPQLLNKINRKHQVIRWKQEWTEPHRLLQKRFLMFPKQVHGNGVQYASANQGCRYEWLVKWCGLGYDHVSWELENSSFLVSSKALRLMKEFENRHKNAKIASGPSRTHKENNVSPVELSMLPGGGSSVSDSKYLCSINKIREYWHKGHNCVVFDDQDRISKIVLFILSLHPHDCRPFLIIASSTTLSSWEAEFSRLAPVVNVVVYCGNNDVRGLIRKLEFYGDGGCVMFQVLLSSLDAIVEDLVSLKFIEWEAIIVDECQKSKMSTNLEQLKPLVTDLKLLIFSGLIKDSAVEYLSLLSFLGPHGDTKIRNGSKAESNLSISELKAKLLQYVAYESKTVSAEFEEYWVPVQLSSIQLEQYCAALVSNSMVLRSCMKTDLVGALRDILMSCRKCCDHPYIVDPSLQFLLNKDLKAPEMLDIGIKASGKLQLLDALLSKIKERGLRVLITFQTIGGPVKDIIGDILEDFLRQRFGQESYERVDGGAKIPSQKEKQAALDNFNNKDCGRFVFLLEYRACLSSIKLSSVDSIIMFDSGWNPVNDIRVLQRVKVYSQFERIKVFRLYSPYTVEENVLALAKQDTTLDSDLQGVSPNISHSLLMWGASFLFKKLDEIHDSNGPSTGVDMSSDQSLLNDSVQEILKVISEGVEGHDTSTSLIILKAHQNAGTYCGNILLRGEREVKLGDEKHPQLFWGELLQRRNFKWKYISGSSQRNRKRVQYVQEFPVYREFESQCVPKKRKKVDKGRSHSGEKEGAASLADIGSPSFPKSTAFVNHPNNANHSSTSPILANEISKAAEIRGGGCRERENLLDAQRSLHLILRPELSTLCEVIQFPENARCMIEKILEYIMNNLKVTSEPVSILQAFQIALCWVTASILGHDYDPDESLALARQHLNFGCKKAEADSIYAKLMDKFSHVKELDFLNGSKSAVKNVTDGPCAEVLQSTASDAKKMKVENKGGLSIQGCSDNEPLPQEGCRKKEISTSILSVMMKHREDMKRLLQKQKEEIFELKKEFEEKKLRVENWKKVGAGFICSMYTTDVPMRTLRLKLLDKDSETKLEASRCELAMLLEDLEAKHFAARIKLKQEICSLQKGISPAQIESVLAFLDKSGHEGEDLSDSEQIGADDDFGTAVPMSGNLSEESSPNGAGEGVPRNDGPSLEKFEDSVESSSHIEKDTVIIDVDDQPVNLSIGKGSDTEVKLQDSIDFCNKIDNVTFRSPFPESMAIQAAQEGSEVAASEVVVGNQQMERVMAATESHRENDGMISVMSDQQTTINSDRCDGAGCSFTGNPISPELSMVKQDCIEFSNVLGNVTFRSLLPEAAAIQAAPQERSGVAASEVAVGNQQMERVTVTTESDRENDGMVSVMSDQQTTIDSNHRDVAGCSITGNPLSSELSMLKHHVERNVTLAQNQSMSNRVQEEVRTYCREQNGSQEVEIVSAHSLVNECSAVSLSNRVPDAVQTDCREQNGSQVAELVSAHLPVNVFSSLSMSSRLQDGVQTDCRKRNGSQEAEGILAHSLVNECFAQSTSSRVHDESQADCREQNGLQDAVNVLEHSHANECSALSLSNRVPDGVQTECMEQFGSKEAENVMADSLVNERLAQTVFSVQNGSQEAEVSNRVQDEVQTGFSVQNASQEAEVSNRVQDAAAAVQQVLPSGELLQEVLSDAIEQQTLELQNECPPLSTSVEVLDESASVEQNVSPIHSNCKASTEGPAIEQQLIQCTDLPSGQSYGSAANGGEHQPGIEGESCFPIDEIPAPIEDPNDAQAPMQSVGSHIASTESSIVENQVIDCTDLPSGQPDLSAENRGEHLQNIGGKTYFQNVEVPLQPIGNPQDAQLPIQSVGNQAEPSNQAFSQFATHSAIHPSPNNLVGGFEAHLPNSRAINNVMEFSNHPAQTMPVVGSRMPRPLSLDPLQIQSERLGKEMEESDKMHDDMAVQLASELEKVIAEARISYAGKIQDVMAAKLQKRRELEKHQHKVQMNRILAEAFRSKCMNPRASGAPRMHHAAASNLMQQLVQQSTPRTNFALGSSSLQLPPTPSIQAIHNPSALFSSVPTRPALVSSVTPFSGNFHTSSEARSPAPHVQPFRAPVSPISPSLARPQVVPLLAHHLSTLPTPLPPSSCPLPPIYPSGPRNVADHHKIVGEVPGLQVTVSGTSLMSLGNLESLDLPLGTPGTRPDRACTGVDSEVVYLSDDD